MQLIKITDNKFQFRKYYINYVHLCVELVTLILIKL